MLLICCELGVLQRFKRVDANNVRRSRLLPPLKGLGHLYLLVSPRALGQVRSLLLLSCALEHTAHSLRLAKGVLRNATRSFRVSQSSQLCTRLVPS